MLSQADLKTRIDAELRAFVATESGLLEAVDPLLAPVGAQLRAAVADGKRVRAAFCYWGWRAAGQGDSPAMVRAAAAMELVHAAALVHDDLIDNSPLRRGVPTPHVALRDATAKSPDPDGAARSLALLVGDLLMAWAGQLFTGCGLPAIYLGRARPMWSVLARELIAGECLEVLRTGTEADPQESLAIVRYKTAKYTVEHPLHIGGRLGGASARTLGAFTDYGLPLGEAFQLRDDLLAVFGDPALTGKSNLDDLTAARPTALVAFARQGADPRDRAVLDGLLGRTDLGTRDLIEVRAILQRSGARGRVEQLIAQRVRRARAALDGANLPRSAAEALHRLAEAVTTRSS
ncbi:polyprenyl synthetase family protein [Catenulispora sp. NF23]|uniref:Polyprenyl synthetase family protein n=1 Tax=Catenulispora pinistramenti TaxID=2705254 RepID=A0ABS5L5E2_9ACTN|nr:polyprenyl synthetase family protein [Catenulispora pinistramenti]MBS2537606.1 polyprenyl synthetase family protein [Catenulispora pinistramenti]MBS2553465.1 polyprenyl synthetase family protein [Catenulispora pinistramenti]